MGKFFDYYKTVMEEVESTNEGYVGVIIDPDRQTIESFEYTENDLNMIRSKMKQPTEDSLNTIPGAVLLFDDKGLSKDDEFIFSLYDEPEDIPVSGVGYIISGKGNSVKNITVDEIKNNVRFGTAEELV